MKRLILVWMCFLSSILGFTNEKYYFRTLSVQDGLSQNTVSAILQDRKGFMWFGTKDGLDRYDGLSFRKFKHDARNPRSIGNNYINALCEDSVGNIWVGTDVGLYIYYPEKDLFTHFLQVSEENTRIEHAVTMIQADGQGNVWAAVETQGLFCYNLKTGTLRNFTLKKFPFISSNVKCFSFDNNGTIWIGFYGNGLFYSKDLLKTLHPYTSPTDGNRSFENDVIMDIKQGGYNCMYISSIKQGVLELDIASNKLNNILAKDENGEMIFCRTLLIAPDNELWIGTETGIYIYNLRSGKYVHLNSSVFDSYSLSDNAIYALCQDREGGVWIGSYFGGVNYYPRPYTYFEKYYPKGDEYSLHGRRVREFCKDNQGLLWIGTEDGGLNYFDPKTKRCSFFSPSAGFTNIHGLCMVGDYLWVGTFSKGLWIIDTRNKSVVKTYQKSNQPYSLTDNNVFSICQTSAGDIYIGTMFGLLRYNRSVDGFDTIEELNGCFVYDIEEDARGNLWLATYANGAYCYVAETKEWKNYVYDEKKEASLPYNKVLSVFEDSNHQIWLTTQGGGFCRFNSETNDFVRYGVHDNISSGVVYQMIEDNEGILWLTTNDGLVRFEPDTEKIKIYTTANGLLGDQFNYRSSFKDVNGTIYLGSIDGFISFNPQTFSENKYLPPIVITDFQLFGKDVLVGGDNSPLKKNITFSDEIYLNSDQNTFSLRMAALDYQAPEMNKLMYMLEGFDANWLTVGEVPLATYANLRHGEYRFKVRGSNSDGVWNEKELVLKIHILPPFYLSGWAYFIYVLLVIGGCVSLYYYLKRWNASRQKRQIEKFEQEKEREVYHAKIDFFTNVAHEIRTPLTLIKGPLENILLKKQLDVETREDLHIMEQNTERLLNLTNQLLDFRKTEGQGYRLNFVKCNVTEILRETHLRFTSLAKQKGLDLELHVPVGDFYAHVNQEAFTKIISNLLNNGVKYADKYVHIYLELKDEAKEFCIRTVNDGVIIPDDMKEEIFQPFVRFNEKQDGKVTTGTGIGLALSRSLAELHQGSLVMEKGETVNCFCLTLPVIQDTTFTLESNEKDVVYSEDVSADLMDKREKPYTILVVEDNPEMLSFVVRQLSHEHSVLTATNGVEALQVLDENFVNLIISDVMMPQMDGFELCKAIKSNLDYSHIPVILLTAKTNLQSKIEGLELGADAYIEKPFSVEYLQASVLSLMSNREKLRQAFAKSPFVAANTMALTKADEEFIEKLNEIISANLHNPDFNMDAMAELLHMSRSSFYRKMKGVLDLTPNEYLRLERLKLAAQLLKDGRDRVNEICYKVGFNSPSYFSRCFQKQFGVLPKDFVG